MKRIAASIQCVALLAAMLLPTLSAFADSSNDRAGGPEFVPGEVLIQFKAGVDESEINRVLARVNGAAAEKVQEALLHRQDQGELILARIPQMMSVHSARRALQEEPTVEFAEPNWIYQHTAVSTDTYYTNGSLWGMYGDATTPANQFGSQAGEAWAANHTDCSGVYVGIIDEGFMFAHEDLSDSAWTNPGDPTFNGADDDGNGFVDDVHGWDFANNDSSTFDGTTDDHGTHVAGTIGGVGGNGKGVAGVCWSGIQLISGKFLGRNGGTTANAVKAVNYFTALKKKNVNVVATNNSWGGGGFSAALLGAINAGYAENILFVAAAGNSTYDCDSGSNCYPGEYEGDAVLSVASITSSGAISSFSNYGKATVDLGAPGSGIYSTLPKSSKGQVVSGYGSYSGTSMAAPHVTGAAALYAATRPGTARSIRDAILTWVVPTASLNGKTVSGGRLNVSSF